MKRRLLSATFLAVVALGVAASEAYGQTAYGISIVRGNPDTRIVDGYSGTWLDYYAGLYYDPEVIGDLYRTDDPETSLSHGRHVGFADLVPAEVYLYTTNYVEGKTYCTYSSHWIWSYYFYQPTSWWFDPFRYSFLGTGNTPWPGFPFSNYYTIPRRHRLGTTGTCITIPALPPPPTPTPTPTPSPSPTPCDPSQLGCAPGLEVFMPRPAPLRPIGTSGFSGGGTTTLVKVCTNPVNVNVPATLTLRRRPQHINSGGHIGTLHGGSRPIGKLARTSGTTGSDGCFSTTYSSSHISGYVGVDGTILGLSVGEDIFVRVDGLFSLGSGPDHVLIGQTSSHPDNHYGTASANTGLLLIASAYRSEFYPSGQIPEDEKVAYNDMSLAFGGKFDLFNRWESTNSQHGEHREGINCDTRSNNIPTPRWARLNQIFRDNGSTRTHDETGTQAPHWHLRFEFGTPRVVERTPHSFVEDAFDTAFRRESTQAEYENWHTRIVNAKAIGQAEFLLEAKLFQRTIFAESEYVARNRTQEEFVSDIYWSHMSREPSQQEIDDWVAYMENLPPSVPANRRRARLIEQVQLLPEFEAFVFGIVDPTLSVH